jgi:hypothetical protein
LTDHSSVANSDERFRHVAETLGMGEDAVRGHVTAWKKAKKKKLPEGITALRSDALMRRCRIRLL